MKITHIAAISAIMASYTAIAQTNTTNTSGTSVGNSNSAGVSGTMKSTNGTGMTSGTAANSDNTWNSENTYWRNNYSTRPYYSSSRSYTLYEPAYRYGMEAYNMNPGRAYNDIDQEQMRKGWEQARGNSSLSWNDAQLATRDAYNRMYERKHDMSTTSGSTNSSAR